VSSPRLDAPRGRRAAGVVLGLFVVGGIIVVFAGTLGRATDVDTRAAEASARVAQLADEVAAGSAELALIEGDDFRRQLARAEGYVGPGERRFALPSGAPSPPPIVPLGSTPDGPARRTPLEAWLALLFGDAEDPG
jgi:hypothetical protein